MSPHQGWGKAGVNGEGFETSNYLLTAVDEQGTSYSDSVQLGLSRTVSFDWPWGQHAAMVLPNGNIFCYDNGWYRNFSWNGDDDSYSRAVEYEVDHENQTVRQVWQYGEERGSEIYSGNISDVDLMPVTGNRLICPGNINLPDNRLGMIIEVTYPQSLVVFEAKINYANIFSTGSGWEEADLIYRSERIQLYPQN